MSKDQLILQRGCDICSDGSLTPAELRMQNHLILTATDSVEDILARNELHYLDDYKWSEGKGYLSLFVRPENMQKIREAIQDLAAESKQAKKVFDAEQEKYRKARDEQYENVLKMLGELQEIVKEE